MAPNEHFRQEEGPFLPWFTTGAGAFAYAIHAMFVQVVDETGPLLLPALPSAVRDARFQRLLASDGVTVSGEVSNGSLVSLTAQSERAMAWSFRIPQGLVSTTRFGPGLTVSSPDDLDLVTVECSLLKGLTRLV
jgi:hypothetical protein